MGDVHGVEKYIKVRKRIRSYCLFWLYVYIIITIIIIKVQV